MDFTLPRKADASNPWRWRDAFSSILEARSLLARYPVPLLFISTLRTCGSLLFGTACRRLAFRLLSPLPGPVRTVNEFPFPCLYCCQTSAMGAKSRHEPKGRSCYEKSLGNKSRNHLVYFLWMRHGHKEYP